MAEWNSESVNLEPEMFQDAIQSGDAATPPVVLPSTEEYTFSTLESTPCMTMAAGPTLLAGPTLSVGNPLTDFSQGTTASNVQNTMTSDSISEPFATEIKDLQDSSLSSQEESLFFDAVDLDDGNMKNFEKTEKNFVTEESNLTQTVNEGISLNDSEVTSTKSLEGVVTPGSLIKNTNQKGVEYTEPNFDVLKKCERNQPGEELIAMNVPFITPQLDKAVACNSETVCKENFMTSTTDVGKVDINLLDQNPLKNFGDLSASNAPPKIEKKSSAGGESKVADNISCQQVAEEMKMPELKLYYPPSASLDNTKDNSQQVMEEMKMPELKLYYPPSSFFSHNIPQTVVRVIKPQEKEHVLSNTTDTNVNIPHFDDAKKTQVMDPENLSIQQNINSPSTNEIIHDLPISKIMPADRNSENIKINVLESTGGDAAILDTCVNKNKPVVLLGSTDEVHEYDSTAENKYTAGVGSAGIIQDVKDVDSTHIEPSTVVKMGTVNSKQLPAKEAMKLKLEEKVQGKEGKKDNNFASCNPALVASNKGTTQTENIVMKPIDSGQITSDVQQQNLNMSFDKNGAHDSISIPCSKDVSQGIIVEEKALDVPFDLKVNEDVQIRNDVDVVDRKRADVELNSLSTPLRKDNNQDLPMNEKTLEPCVPEGNNSVLIPSENTPYPETKKDSVAIPFCTDNNKDLPIDDKALDEPCYPKGNDSDSDVDLSAICIANIQETNLESIIAGDDNHKLPPAEGSANNEKVENRDESQQDSFVGTQASFETSTSSGAVIELKSNVNSASGLHQPASDIAISAVTQMKKSEESENCATQINQENVKPKVVLESFSPVQQARMDEHIPIVSGDENRGSVSGNENTTKKENMNENIMTMENEKVNDQTNTAEIQSEIIEKVDTSQQKGEDLKQQRKDLPITCECEEYNKMNEKEACSWCQKLEDCDCKCSMESTDLIMIVGKEYEPDEKEGKKEMEENESPKEENIVQVQFPEKKNMSTFVSSSVNVGMQCPLKVDKSTYVCMDYYSDSDSLYDYYGSYDSLDDIDSPFGSPQGANGDDNCGMLRSRPPIIRQDSRKLIRRDSDIPLKINMFENPTEEALSELKAVSSEVVPMKVKQLENTEEIPKEVKNVSSDVVPFKRKLLEKKLGILEENQAASEISPSV